ncbi:MAG: Uma2 family endonuclease [Ardenticatenales bacterium]|nr:Uma2 family endonuclease [Ardenticatenales bacterium]
MVISESQDVSLALRLEWPTSLPDEAFYEFCRVNKTWRIERTAKGDLIIMVPTGGESSRRNVELIAQLHYWASREGSGVIFDSSGGFVLPNGAIRAPDAAWVRRERLTSLTPEQKRKFVPLCPDFVVELRSPSESLVELRAKMEEYLANGAMLGWLLDPGHRKLFVYQAGFPVQQLDNPATVSADPVLPDFVIDLRLIWEPDL